MKLTFNKNYFIAFLLLFLTEAAIAYFLNSGFIRHTLGDFLVVILMYFFFRSFLKTKVLTVAIVTLVIAYFVEFIQLTDFLAYFGLEKKRWANLIFGNTFSVQDLIAYTLGVIVIYVLDKHFLEVRFLKRK